MFSFENNPVPIIVFIVAVLGIVAFSYCRNHRIKRDGIEAEAFITRIDESDSHDSDGGIITTYTYYVRYRDQNGTAVDATLVNPKNKLVIGSRLKIKYMPEKPKVAVMTERAE